MLDIDIKAKAVAADAYWDIQEEIEQKETADYIWHDNRLEHNSKLPKWVGKKIILAKKIFNEKRFKPKDILLAQNLSRSIVFVCRAAADRHYNITEADVRHIHFMLSENMVSKPGEYRTSNTDVTVPDIPKHMTDLVDFINSRDYRRVERAAFAHYRVVQIQPFLDFNKAVARLIMNFILIRHRYPLTIVEADEYLDCLTKDPIYFLQFVTSKVLSAVNSYRVTTNERLNLELAFLELEHASRNN